MGATFGVSEHHIDAWVADYRWHGMTSLRRATGETLTAKIVQMTVSPAVREAASRMSRGFRRLLWPSHLPRPCRYAAPTTASAVNSPSPISIGDFAVIWD